MLWSEFLQPNIASTPILNIKYTFSYQKQGLVTQLSFRFSTSFPFLKVVHPPGDHLPMEQLGTTYLVHTTGPHSSHALLELPQ
jgi:hypothetical protein